MLKTILSKLSGKEKTIYLVLTIVAGMIILWPLHNFQHYLAQGDHGRDLYCFKKVMEGALPYRDFSWLFGPLMPYYYALFYLFGGVSIQSILFGQILLIFLAGIVIYLTCCVFLPPAISFLCAFWYWGYRGTEFFYTYNHIGGLLTLLIALYCLFKYIELNERRFICGGFVSILSLMLIRLNMGVSTLTAFVLSLFFSDFIQKDPKAPRKRRFYLLLSLGILAIAFLIYWFLLYPLPKYAITQSFPFEKTQRTDYTSSVFDTVLYSWGMLANYFTATLSQKIFGLILVFASLQCLILGFSNKTPHKLKERIIIIFGSLFLFLALSSHEFFASGVFYRIFWFFPLILITIFFLLGIATRDIRKTILQVIIFYTLLLPPLFNIHNEIRIIRFFKTPEHQLHVGPNNIFTTQDPKWFQTVAGAVDFIKKNTRPDEKILVLPLDPIYLFLSGRDSAARQLVFFEHINITEPQQRDIISEMETNHANWAIISNRAVTPEGGMGVFGQTHCLLLAQYLRDHFEPAADFGDWIGPPGWAWNHSVQILKRKPIH
ncbi:MAG: hypothetical protein JW847_05875 [Candidatus Omnitrophica bacterium]|nr:hypothetical protein [Candidatus Omnitrophota bacterium]